MQLVETQKENLTSKDNRVVYYPVNFSDTLHYSQYCAPVCKMFRNTLLNCDRLLCLLTMCKMVPESNNLFNISKYFDAIFFVTLIST